MIEALTSHTFNGIDLALCLIAIAAAALGARHDRKRNAR